MIKKITLFVLIFILAALTAYAKPAAAVTKDYTNPEVLVDLVENHTEKYILVDVRTPGEYAGGYIPTAVNIPVDSIGNNPPTEDKDALIILYCRSGNRSGRAQSILEAQGYTNTYNFGSYMNWPKEFDK